MPKGYWIVRVDVSDPDLYKKYVAANAEPISRFGGRFIVRGGEHESVEGHAARAQRRRRVPELSRRRATATTDAAYQEASKLRGAASAADFVIIEGYDGPQPGD